MRTAFEGKGNPEPLKEILSGYWFRRIDRGHRLIYKVFENSIHLVSCRHHY